MLRLFFSTLLFALALNAGSAYAGDNIDRVQQEVESRGWNVVWGSHIDYSSYGWCIGGYLLFDQSIIQSCIASTFSSNLLTFGHEAVKEIIQHWGQSIEIDGIEYQGGIASYKHWQRTPIGKVDLPNTHQPYILWRQAD